MKVMLSDTARHFITLFGEETEATIHDCLVFDDRVVFLIVTGDMVTAIGPGGRTVQSIGRRLGRTVELVEDADTPEAFVANALMSAAVRHVTFSRWNDTIMYVEVTGADRGVTIGASGKTIDTARELARCHHGIDDTRLM